MLKLINVLALICLIRVDCFPLTDLFGDSENQNGLTLQLIDPFDSLNDVQLIDQDFKPAKVNSNARCLPSYTATGGYDYISSTGVNGGQGFGNPNQIAQRRRIQAIRRARMRRLMAARRRAIIARRIQMINRQRPNYRPPINNGGNFGNPAGNPAGNGGSFNGNGDDGADGEDDGGYDNDQGADDYADGAEDGDDQVSDGGNDEDGTPTDDQDYQDENK